MSGKKICSLHNIEVRRGENIILKDISLNIEEPIMLSIISEDESAGSLLRLLAGLMNINDGEIVYPAWDIHDKTDLSKWMQYVPDDIVCYRNMKVKEFLRGISLSGPGRGTEEQGLRLCELFDIDPEEQLLELTFEQNRLVAMIQAMMIRPRVLLLDRPYDLISKKMYVILLQVILKLRKMGTSIIIAADAYRDIILPCNRYLFLKEGTIVADYRREELPQPAKVITLEGGSLKSMKKSLMTVLYRNKARCGILYREQDVRELVARIYMSGCHGFCVNELSMEEEVFENYERWKQ